MDIKGAGLYQEMQAFARQARSLSGDMQTGQAQVEFSACLNS